VCGNQKDNCIRLQNAINKALKYKSQASLKNQELLQNL